MALTVNNCADCGHECNTKAGGRRARCFVCKFLLCVWCYREHKAGNDQIAGGCTAHMDAVQDAREAGI